MGKRERIAMLAMILLFLTPTVAAEEAATEEPAANGAESSESEGPSETPEALDDLHKMIRVDPVGDAIDRLEGGGLETGPGPFDCVDFAETRPGTGVPVPSFGQGSHDTPTWTWYTVEYDPDCRDD